MDSKKKLNGALFVAFTTGHKNNFKYNVVLQSCHSALGI